MKLDDMIKTGEKLSYSGAEKDSRVRRYVPAERIVYMTKDELSPNNPEVLVNSAEKQSYIHFDPPICKMKPGSAILLDFGIEMNGGIRIVTAANDSKVSKVRVRFGESVSEAMQTPVDHHAMHNTIFDLAPMAHNEIGNTGFRFVRIDIQDDCDHDLELISIMAVALYRDLEYVGSFSCSDERLNQIWKTAAYTVHLNMQDYLYDGIKRDRLVWMGDMHPEIRTIGAVFHDEDTVNSSLNFVKTHTPLPNFMNGISSYSLWWIISQHDWFMMRGNMNYLREQHEYLSGLLRLLSEFIDENGSEKLEGARFLDWPSSEDEKTIHAGLQALMVWAFTAGKRLAGWLEDTAMAQLCSDSAARLKKHLPEAGTSKQANALLAIAGMLDPEKANREVLAVNPFAGISTFYGYYMLQGRALGGDCAGALEVIRRYWGAMLDFGATTFWEDFDLSWTENACGIDEIPVPGKADIHADFGNYCYLSLRHSLCHGWASGPAAWMSEHLLGVKPLEPGFKVAEVKPQLAGLDWIKGTVPTPYGPIKVSAQKDSNGNMKVDIQAPEGITVK